MTIESLLNPEFEQNMLDKSTVLEIFESVKHAREVHENSSISGEDNDIDDDSPAIECPSRYEALQATATIQKFVAEMNGPFAKKLENILAMFGHKTQLEITRSMKNTSITDFFTHKA